MGRKRDKWGEKEWVGGKKSKRCRVEKE